MIKSKFSFFVYLSTFGLSGLIMLGAYFLAHPEMQLKNKFGGTNSAVIPGLILAGGAGLMLFLLLRRVYVLKIDPDRLAFSTLFAREILQRKDISSIDPWGRNKVFGNQADMLTVEMTDGRQFAMPDQLCRNMPELKRTLVDVYKEFIPPPPKGWDHANPSVTEADSESETFAGNFLLSLNGILLVGMTIPFLWLTLKIYRDHTVGWIMLVPVITMLVFAAGFGAQLFYFRISADRLEVRNHIFFWYKKDYLCHDIVGVIFEHVSRRSNALRIRTNDFRTRSYAAGSLWDKHWLALAKALKKRKIPVHNEIGSLKS
jgi:hypothetical protein